MELQTKSPIVISLLLKSEGVILEIILFIATLLGRIAPIYTLLYEFLCCKESWFGEFLIIAADFNLLSILENLLKAVVVACKLRQFLVQVLLYLCRNLIGTLADDSYTFIDVASIVTEFHDVTSNGVYWCF